jgi:hypothetical protein
MRSFLLPSLNQPLNTPNVVDDEVRHRRDHKPRAVVVIYRRHYQPTILQDVPIRWIATLVVEAALIQVLNYEIHQRLQFLIGCPADSAV